MATSNLSFGAQVSEWVRKSEARMTAVFRESTQRLVSEAQSWIPIDTGFARASVRASTSEIPPIIPGSTGTKGTNYPYDGGQIAAVIANAEIGQTLYVGWTAGYVGLLENGHSKQAPSGFVGVSALQWPAIVSQVTQEAKGRAGPEPGPGFP